MKRHWSAALIAVLWLAAGIVSAYDGKVEKRVFTLPSYTTVGGKMKETYGVPVEEIQEAIKHGVRKVNIDTDIRLAMTAAIRKYLFENPGKFDPRDYLKPAREAAKGICKQRYVQFGCEGQAGRIQPLALTTVAHKYQTGELSQHVH